MGIQEAIRKALARTSADRGNRSFMNRPLKRENKPGFE
jgi:hypothetical protein